MGGLSSFLRTSCQTNAVVVHEITYHGRDHIIKVRSGESALLIINVHFEPGLRTRNFRERLRRIVFHWLRYPERFGINFCDFNICEPEEGRFNVMNQTFTEGDAGRIAVFRTLFHTPWESWSQAVTRKDVATDGTPRTLSTTDRAFINVPIAKARDFHCHSHRVTTWQFALSYGNHWINGAQASESQVGCPNIPSSAPF